MRVGSGVEAELKIAQSEADEERDQIHLTKSTRPRSRRLRLVTEGNAAEVNQRKNALGSLHPVRGSVSNLTIQDEPSKMRPN